MSQIGISIKYSNGFNSSSSSFLSFFPILIWPYSIFTHVVLGFKITYFELDEEYFSSSTISIFSEGGAHFTCAVTTHIIIAEQIIEIWEIERPSPLDLERKLYSQRWPMTSARIPQDMTFKYVVHNDAHEASWEKGWRGLFTLCRDCHLCL